jgi:hypothetical protein
MQLFNELGSMDIKLQNDEYVLQHVDARVEL